MEKSRYYLIDALRGLAVCSMVVYHLCWDIQTFAGWDMDWFNSDWARVLWQEATCQTFILISGFCLPGSRRWPRRGALLLGLGCAIWAGSALIMPQNAIRWGILCCLGACTLLAGVLLPAIKRVPAIAGAAASWVLFWLVYPVAEGSLFGLALPRWLYQTHVGAILGFRPRGFASTDYFPLLPWGLLFLTGVFLGLWAAKKRLPVLQWRCKPLQAIGRYALPIYLAHQPLIMAGLYIAGAVG